MKLSIVVGLFASLFIAQASGINEEEAEDLLSNPSLAGKLMDYYIGWKVGDNYESQYTNLEEYVKFNLYTRENRIFSQDLVMNDAVSLSKSNFNAAKPTFILIHGYINNLYMPAIQVPKNALLEKYDCNVIGVDWGKISVTLSYPVAAAETKRVGAYVADMVKFLMSVGGLDLSTTQFIGHSLGAHVSGFAGKNLKGLGLARITGLDPALPGFSDAGRSGRLDASDALYVDCIHTCGGKLGFEKPICQADFYPNGGKNQPGCKFDTTGTCSHLRVIDLYAESVTSKFKSSQCSSVPNASGRGCKRSSMLMGQPANTRLQGIFYVKTKGEAPFSA